MSIQPFQLAPRPLTLDAVSTAPVTGPSKGVYYCKDVSGVIEMFYSDDQGREIQITENGDLRSTGGSGEANTVSSPAATGASVFIQKTGVDLEFRKFIAGANITINELADQVQIEANIPSGGEINTGTSLGAGEGEVFKQKSGSDLEFRSIKQGNNVTITQDANEITIDAATSGESNTASNVGGESEVFKQKSGADLEFRTLKAGANITINQNADDLEIVSAAGSGEANTASNVSGGSGLGLFKQKTGVDLQFFSLLAGSNVTITQNGDDIEIASTGGGGGGGGETNTASNVGGELELFKQKAGVDLQFRTLKQGTNVTLTQNADDITIDGPVPGETNTISNVGGEAEIAKAKSGVDFPLRTLKAGTNVTITQNTDDIEISASGGGGSVDEFSFVLPAAATLNARIGSVTGLPANWSLDTADSAGEGQFGTDAETLVITWDPALGAKTAQEITVLQKTTSGPTTTQGIQKLDLSAAGSQKTKTDETKAAAFMSGKGLSTTKDIEVFIKLI